MSLVALWDVPAPAKLNLFLHIIGRRPDGYHLLQSVFVLIDWCDTLHFERRNDGLLRRHDLGPALPADDLSLRAARALQQASGTRLGADLTILKRLPWGAGLGGGSSDAATTLLALNRLWGLRWPRARLQPLALALGADVPFFVGGHNAFVEGIGEQLTPLPPQALPAQRYAVLKPAAAVATADIFASPFLVRNTEAVIVMSFLADAQLPGTMGMLGQGWGRNDLQAAVLAKVPEGREVAQAADWLQARFGNSRMSGSGSAVFARVSTESAQSGNNVPPLATDLAQLVDLVDLAEAIPPGWVGRMCRSLNHHPLVAWAD